MMYRSPLIFQHDISLTKDASCYHQTLPGECAWRVDQACQADLYEAGPKKVASQPLACALPVSKEQTHEDYRGQMGVGLTEIGTLQKAQMELFARSHINCPAEPVIKPLRGRESHGCLRSILMGSPTFQHSNFSLVWGFTPLQLIVIFLWFFPVHCDPVRLLVALTASPRFQNQNGTLMCRGPEPVRFLTDALTYGKWQCLYTSWRFIR